VCQVPTETFKTTKMQAEAVCKMKQTETKVDSAIDNKGRMVLGKQEECLV